MENQLLVAVWMVAYNHGEFIENAIESVMMQKSTFKYKLFIGEDNSTDKTREICKSLKEKYPDKIELFLHEKNIGSNPNGVFMYKQCFNSGSKYIAMCEGDDYWTDPYKLQKQVDFLEENKDCSFCFHKANKRLENQNNYSDSYPKGIRKKKLNADDFFSISTIPTASVVFRTSIKFPKIHHSHGDFILYCSLLSNGLAGYIDEIMSIYRLHDGGVSSFYNSNAYLENRIIELNVEKKFLNFSIDVRRNIGKILTRHILFYLGKNRGKLSLIQKYHNLRLLLAEKSFYKLSLKEYLGLIKTLLR